MITSFFLDPTFGLILALCLFFILAAIPMKKSFLDMTDQYRVSIQNQFNEAELLLREAQDLLKAARIHHEKQSEQEEEILNLANQEASFLLQQTREECGALKNTRQSMLQDHTDLLIEQWKLEISELLINKIFEHIKSFLKTQDPQASAIFLQDKLKKLTWETAFSQKIILSPLIIQNKFSLPREKSRDSIKCYNLPISPSFLWQ